MSVRKNIKEAIRKVLKELEFAGTQNEVPMIIKSLKGYHLGMAEPGVSGSMVTRSIESPAFKDSSEVCKFYSNWDSSRATMEESYIVEDGGRGYSVVGDPEKICVVNENIPAGAEFDTSAQFNQVDAKPIQNSKNIKYSVVWYGDNAGVTLLNDESGNLYVFNTDSVDDDSYAPYASREGEYMGHEDGVENVEYGEWELDGDVVENYINDNINVMSIGNGLEEFNAGANMSLVDDALKRDLIGLSKYIKNNKEEFDKVVNGSIDEMKKLADKMVDTKTMDTPTGTLFVMSIAESVHKEFKKIVHEYKKDNKRRD